MRPRTSALARISFASRFDGWLLASPLVTFPALWYTGVGAANVHLLAVQRPWSRLTWAVVCLIPVAFIVGGLLGAAIAAVLAADVDGPVNIGSGEAVAVRTVAERIAALVGRPDLLAFDESPRGPDLLVADVTRLSTEVGFTPASRVMEALGETVNWWRGRVDLDATAM